MTETGAPPLVRVEHADGLATLTLDSPHNRNALSAGLIGELLAAVAAATADDAVRAILLTHTGPVFCSGADLRETAAAFAAANSASSPDEAGDAVLPAARMGELLAAVWESPKPVVARVAGPARAGGLGLIAAADIAICTTEATFSFSEVRLGVVPAVISATVLRRLNPRAAAELYLTGDTFDGARAERIGLVSAAVPTADLDDKVAGYAAALRRGAPGALATAKVLARRAPGASVRDDLAELTALSVTFFTSAEGREGVASFVEKRDPFWVS